MQPDRPRGTTQLVNEAMFMHRRLPEPAKRRAEVAFRQIDWIPRVLLTIRLAAVLGAVASDGRPGVLAHLRLS